MERIIVKGKESQKSIIFNVREDGVSKFLKLPFNNYFFILKEDYDDISFVIRDKIKATEEISDRFNTKYIKLILKNNFHRNIVKNVIENANIRTFEADVDSIKRFLILNQNIPLHQDKLKSCYFDIETDDRKPLDAKFNEEVNANSCILSFAVKDTTGKIFYDYNRARDTPNFINDDLLRHEKDLLIKIFSVLKQYDLVHAYNGWKFDYPFIKQRAEKHNLLNLYEELMQQHNDYMQLYKKYIFGTFKSFSLNAICQREFGSAKDITEEQLKEVTKIDWRELTGLKKFYELYKERPDLLKEYNIQDVNLMYMLENKLQLNKLTSVVAGLCHCFYVDTLFNSHSFDYAMLNEYHKRFLIGPSKPSQEERDRRVLIKIGGGYTYCYYPGRYKDLPCFDFKSFYPTSSITFNISPDTLMFVLQPSKEELLEIFTTEEYNFMFEVFNSKHDFINAKNELNIGKYNANIKKISNGLDIEKLMWKFIDNYESKNAQKIAKEKDLIFTPADMNFDTNGWTMHPHRFFRKEEGVYPSICKRTIIERDKAKYKLVKIEKEKGKKSVEWQETSNYSGGLKLLGNAGFGTFGFRSFRFFEYDVVDTITTSCRWIMKKTISFARKHKYEAIFGDSITGDSKIVVSGKELTIEEYFNINSKYSSKIRGKDIINVENNFDNILSIIKLNKVYQRNSFINKIIRHKTQKKLYKIITKSDKKIVVTEDHSIPIFRGKYLEPKTKDINVGDFIYVKTVIAFKKEEIVKIECLGEVNAYVYDLEVENAHTFLANDIFVHNTDSSYFYDTTQKKDFRIMDAKFYEYYNILIRPFNTNTKIEHTHPITKIKEIKNHFTVFEHEKTFDSCISVAKKRYYYKETLANGEVSYSTKGGAYKKSDCMPYAAKLQKELCKDILDYTYDRNKWLKKILEIKKLVYEDKLEVEQMLMIKAVSKKLDDYGLPVIDSKTGLQKVRKSDGAPMFAPIPAHILIAKYYKEINEEIEVGDKINFVIYDKSGKIIPLDLKSYNKLKELKEKGLDVTNEVKKITYIMSDVNDLPDKVKEKFNFNKLYDNNYYWERISSVLLEILVTVDKKHCFSTFKDCWNMSEKQILREIEKLNLEE